jgi:hypothetical protein
MTMPEEESRTESIEERRGRKEGSAIGGTIGRMMRYPTRTRFPVKAQKAEFDDVQSGYRLSPDHPAGQSEETTDENN